MIGKRSRRMLLLALIVAAQPSRLSLIVGLSIAAASELWVVLSYGAFTRKGDTRGRLITTGPFAFLRNPVYFGYMMVGVGFTVAAGFHILPAILGAAYLAVVIPNYLFRIRREESLLAAQFGEKFEQYRRRVRWRLVPSPISGILNGGFRLRWSLCLALENRSIAKAGKTLTWMLVFTAKWAIFSKWFRKDVLAPLAHRDLPWFLLVLVAAVLIMVIPGMLLRRLAHNDPEPSGGADDTA
jgi:hypothetical protein